MKRLVALAVAVLILGWIFAHIDRSALWNNLRATRLVPFAVALFLFIPQNFIMAYRWKLMAENFIEMGWGRAIGLILAGQTMNVLLPSKMGDLTKAYFLNRAGALDLPRATSLVVFEKMLDMGSLCLLALVGALSASLSHPDTSDPAHFKSLSMLTGVLSFIVIAIVSVLYFVPHERLGIYRRFESAMGASSRFKKVYALLASTGGVVRMLQRREARRGYLVFLSVGLWGLHLVQIYFFFLSLNAPVPLLAFASLMPLAIFVGLLPLSLFGMGTRDAAIIFLFAPYHPAAIMAGVGLYVSLRYVIPALAGLPFLQIYLGAALQAKSAAGSGR